MDARDGTRQLREPVLRRQSRLALVVQAPQDDAQAVVWVLRHGDRDHVVQLRVNAASFPTLAMNVAIRLPQPSTIPS